MHCTTWSQYVTWHITYEYFHSMCISKEMLVLALYLGCGKTEQLVQVEKERQRKPDGTKCRII